MIKFAIIERDGVTESHNPAHQCSAGSWCNTSVILEGTGPEDVVARLLQFPVQDLRAEPFGEAAFEVVHRSCLQGNENMDKFDVFVLVVPLA